MSTPKVNFVDFLIPSVNKENPDIEARIITNLLQVEINPFAEPGSNELIHYVLHLRSECRYTDDPDNDYFPGKDSSSDYPLKFFGSFSKAPSMADFSQHIYIQCRAALLASSKGFFKPFRNRSEIDLIDVYNFQKNLFEDFSRTEDFIRDYDYWHQRLYDTQKWVHYLSGTLVWDGGHICIGDRIYQFLDLVE